MSGLFLLNRDRDESGVSGIGIVAWGCQFPDGQAILRWRAEHKSTAIYASMRELVAIHGHGGATRVEWVTPEVWERVAHGPTPGPTGEDERKRIRKRAASVLANPQETTE